MPELGPIGASDATTPIGMKRRRVAAKGPTTTTGLLAHTAAGAAIDLVPGTRVGEYVVQGRVGRGGMGSVYAAVHPVIGKKAAIKVIAWDLCRDPTFVARFIEEARAVNLIGHPNIVESFSIGRLEDGRPYYVMEWLDGINLGDRLRRGRLPLAEALEILDDTADALGAVHAKGVVHRDLTPQNLFLVADRHRRQTVKVFDFGLAKRVANTGNVPLTQSGVMIGTPPYASPEQLCGDRTDTRSDVYSLGVIAYEMILGRRPYDDPQLRALVTRKLTEPPPPPRSIWPEIPLELEWMLAAMLSIDPARRPDLAAVRRALDRVRSRALDPQPAPRRRRVRWFFAAAVVLAAALAGAVIGLGRPADESEPAAQPAGPLQAARAPVEASPSPPAVLPVEATPADQSAPAVAPHQEAPARPGRAPRRAHRTRAAKAAPAELRPEPRDPDRYLLEPDSR